MVDDWQDLKDLMREAGEVLRAEVLMEAGGTGHRGGSIVMPASPAAAANAIATLDNYD